MVEKYIKMFKDTPTIILLQGKIVNYKWGGSEFIPQLLNIANEEEKPFAELWIGTHPQGPAKAYLGDKRIDLNQFIESAPEHIRGKKVNPQFTGK